MLDFGMIPKSSYVQSAASGRWYRAETLEEALNLKEFLDEAGNRCVTIHEWVGLMHAPVAGDQGQVQLIAVPFRQ